MSECVEVEKDRFSMSKANPRRARANPHKYTLRAFNSALGIKQEWKATEREYQFALHAPFLHELEELKDGRWRMIFLCPKCRIKMTLIKDKVHDEAGEWRCMNCGGIFIY